MSELARAPNDLARLALRSLVLMGQGVPADTLEERNAGLRDAGSAQTFPVPGAKSPWFAKASQIVDSVQRLASSGWAREAADSVLEAVVNREAGLVWLTDDRLRVRYALAMGVTPFDPYDGFLGSDLVEHFESRDSGRPVVAAHLDALSGRPAGFVLREGASETPFRVEPVHDSKGKIVGCCARGLAPESRKSAPDAGNGESDDARARRRLEEQLRQSQKLEAVGRLAGWVAHDFNNLLTTILGYSDLILSSDVPSEQLRSDIEEIRRAGQSATVLTRQILAFSKREVSCPQPVDLADTFDSLKRILGRMMGEDVDVVIKTTEGLAAHFDPGEIEQVILRLAARAREAMPRGGRLVLEAKTSDSCVMISMSDSGDAGGADSRGPEIDLSAVRAIVEEGSGGISARSVPGEGTTIDIVLPLSSGSTAVSLPEKQSPGSLASEQKSVLLVEDAADVRALTRRVLSQNGYRVIEAENGVEALLVSSAHKGPISLLLTDVVMPLMSGPETARRLRELRPEVRVLFMSGYAGEAIVRHGLKTETDPSFLAKPFTPQELLLGVREAIDGAVS